LVSLAQIQEIPSRTMILLVGPPGAGKSTFCQQVVVQSLAIDKPIIFATTEYGSSEAERALKERGLREVEPGLLNFVNAYYETVGLSVSDRPDTVNAHCEDLSSIGIAISKLSERIGRKGVLLVFDSLTSPYLFSGSEVLRFMRQTLSRFAAEGNAVLACIDEGCGRPEDLVAMMSLSNGVIKLEREDGRRMLNVVKHPVVEPTRVEAPGAKIPEKLWDFKIYNEEILEFTFKTIKGEALPRIRRELGNDVNLFWLNFVHWSEILWDPKGFPEMAYEMAKMHGEMAKEIMPLAPWHQRLLSQLLMPKSFSRVKDMKKAYKGFQKMVESSHFGIVEYLEEVSKTDEHYLRIYECYECWGFENVGAPMAYWFPANVAGGVKGLESWRGLERDWNAIETKCIGLGDPYCEFKLVPGEIPELKDSLEKDSQVIDRVHDRLMGRLMGFLLDGKPLVERPSGSDVFLGSVTDVMDRPAWAGERYRTVMRMAGAKAGKEVGEHLTEAGIREDEAVKRVLNLLEHCKVGKVTVDETIRMKESLESVFYGFMTKKREEPSCYFTTGFINGLFTTVKNQHIRETKCIAMGEPYCEWEFR
jgi:predicted hydrocarbon binding protein/KaiC/GvpD/RAD55 family RecA-like ATPase